MASGLDEVLLFKTVTAIPGKTLDFHTGLAEGDHFPETGSTMTVTFVDGADRALEIDIASTSIDSSF